MSYFNGTVISSSSCQRRIPKRHSRLHTVSMSDHDLEPVHGIRPHSRRNSGRKHLLKMKSVSKDPIDNICDEETASSSRGSRGKSRRHLHKQIERLVEENRLLSSKLNEVDLGSLTEKDAQLAKTCLKNQKLEKSFYEIQADRDRLAVLLSQRDIEFRQLHIHHEEATQLLQNHEKERCNLFVAIQKLKTENSQLNEDVALLKNLVYRLNVELERYQEKLQISGQYFEPCNVSKIIDEIGTDYETKKDLSNDLWRQTNVHALGPLITAYHENISEKEEQIKKYRKELEEFDIKCREIISTNEILQTEVDNLKSKCNKYVTDIKVLEENTALIKEQNDALSKQATLQKHKMQEMHLVYGQKVESMSEDNNKVHKEYLACKTELSNIKGKFEILNEGYEKLKGNMEKTMPVSVHTATVDDCKRLFEELKLQYETEKKKLNLQIKNLEESNPENERQLIATCTERDHLKIQVKNLEKNLKRTQHKLESIQNRVYSMQVSRDSFKRQLHKTTMYCKDLVTEYEKLVSEKQKLTALLQDREKENNDIHHLGDNIAHRIITLKNQLKSVQQGAKEQLASMEKHMKNQEYAIEQMKSEYQRELERLKQLVRQKEDVIRQLQKEKCATQGNLELIWKTATNNEKKPKEIRSKAHNT